MLYSLTLLCEFRCQSPDPGFRNTDETFDKTEELPLNIERSDYGGNEVEEIILFLQLRRC